MLQLWQARTYVQKLPCTEERMERKGSSMRAECSGGLERHICKGKSGGEKGHDERPGFSNRPVKSHSGSLVKHDVSLTDSNTSMQTIDYEFKCLEHRVRNEPLRNRKWKCGSVEWLTRHVWDQTMEIAVRDLKAYVRNDREVEINPEFIQEINEMT